MISFSAFQKLREALSSNPHAGITYVPVYPDDNSVHKIMNLQQDLGITNPEPANELHCTIVYSRTPVKLPDDSIIAEWLPAEATGYKLRQFDYSTLGTKCLVLEMKSVRLPVLHNELRKYGATHDYPDFIPHVTLTKDLKDDVDLKQDLNIDLVFTDYEVKRYEK